MNKKSEASGAFSSWCFFGLNEVAFFSCSLFVSSILSCIGTFLLSMCPNAHICLSVDIV